MLVRSILVLCLATVSLDAQATAVPPPGWAWVLDAPAKLVVGSRNTSTDSTFDFVHMAPGWHITMGPGGVLYDATVRADGRFIVEGEMILFPDASDAEYGIVVGGAALGGASVDVRWSAFVVRSDGSAAVFRHADGVTTALMPWSVHAAVVRKAAGGTAKNFVRVLAEPDSVRFVVNGQPIAAWSRASVSVDGTVGFRIGRGINLHVTNLDLTRRLAPFPNR